MIKKILKIALPAMMTNVMVFATFLINNLFAGRLNDPVKLAAVGLSNACCNVMVFVLMLGLNAA